MATSTKRTRFSRRLPDHVTDELVNALTIKKTYEFNTLFEAVYEQLKLRNAVSGGEEMLRLRAYEKLQNLVSRGLVEKIGKTYRGLEGVQNARTPVAIPMALGVGGIAAPAPVIAPAPPAPIAIAPKVSLAPVTKIIPMTSGSSKVTTTVTKVTGPSKVTSISKVTSSKVLTKPRPKVAAR
jgi:hypothetical protein